MENMFKNKIVLITGGTGSLGKALTKKLLKTDVKNIRIFSRDEWKQVNMESEISDDRVRYLIGDVREKDRLLRALENVDIVIHAAALKQVPVAEYNPFEAVKTNVYGTQNLVEACLDKGVKIAVAVGTDKAVSPLNTYGATKLLMEREFISANFSRGTRKTKFLCVRYGNVLGSRGSVAPIFVNQVTSKKNITITDPTMTRFNITMNQALDLIMYAIKYGNGGEVFIPKLKAYKLADMKDAIINIMNVKPKVEKISVRPGEKFHESLINLDEMLTTYETKNHYILFTKQRKKQILPKIPGIKKTKRQEPYSSNKVELLTINEIKKILLKEKLIP